MASFCCRRSGESDDGDEIPPIKYSVKPGIDSPEQSANIASRMFFYWAQPLFTRASFLHKRGKALEQNDLIPLPAFDSGASICKKFENGWSKASRQASEQQLPHARSSPPRLSEEDQSKHLMRLLRRSLLSVIGRRFAYAGIIKFFNTMVQFAFPLLLNSLLKFIEETDRGEIDENAPGYERYKGYWLSALLLTAMGVKAMTENFYFHAAYRAGYQAKVAVSTAVYAKALRLSSTERQGTTIGELVNLMQVDSAKIEMFVPQIHVLWDGLLQISGYIAILYTLIGWPCFAGMIVMILAGPLQGVIMGKLFGLNRELVKYTDARVKVTNEALQGIRCVKMYTWEDSFQTIVSDSRTTELSFLKRVAYLRGFSRAYISALPGIVAVASFVVYATATDRTVKASTLFAALLAFDQLRFPLLFYPMTLAQLAQAQVSAERVSRFLGMREIKSASSIGGGAAKYSRDSSPTGASSSNVEGGVQGEIVIKGARVYWNDPSKPMPLNKQGSTLDGSFKDLETDDDQSEGTASLGGTPMPKVILKDVSLKVSHGELCAVIGRVGCGKTTLCSAILNETVLGESSEIFLKGAVAYAAQSPWILNATLQENILFGLPMNEEKYDAVVKACQLTHDLEMLDHGDKTEIGERGINLSGGQKQRVSIARAAYSEADIIVMDDPLSALDPEVGQQLFDECIIGLMKNKTRLLVTNQLQCLKDCDTVVALGGGRVLEQGTYEDLAQSGGEVQRILDDLGHSYESKKEQEGSEEVDKDISSGKTEHAVEEKKDEKVVDSESIAKLTTTEERNVGAVKLSVYLKYIQAGGGYLIFAAVYFVFILTAAVGLLTNVWVTVWTSDPEYENHPIGFYLGWYAATAVALGLVTFFRSYIIARFGVIASNTLHKNVLASVLRAPMSFFDTTPTGRIISRFSKDMYSIDSELSDYFDFFLFMSLSVIVALATITYVTPFFGVAVIPLLFLYIWALNYFREVSRETKRLESISRSPVYSHFSETLGGLATIRAYEQPSRFMDNFELILDQNTRAYYNNKVADRWLSVRLELIGAFVAGIAAFCATYVVIADAVTGGGTSNFASLAGLSITSAVQVTGLLNWCVRMFAQLESSMNAVERVLHYTENIPHEAPATSDALEAHANSGNTIEASDPSAYAVVASRGKAVHPSPDWPATGSVTLNNLLMRYRPTTPLVLKGLDVSIAGGERVGIVGRTGSGKSSLLFSLMRIVEPDLGVGAESDKYLPPITIDGVDILRIGLDDLRTKIGIIPQNPVLFSGSIRTNLDPFDQYKDEEIWSALSRCGMKEAVAEMPEELYGQVAEFGDNLSQGQRQLLCLGRALLKQCRVLLLDEATSSVDYETDREIQRTLREAFEGCTVLTIAHRVNTIMDSDKILVMKDGLAAEFASPKELMENENSLFSDIVRHSKAEK